MFRPLGVTESHRRQGSAVYGLTASLLALVLGAVVPLITLANSTSPVDSSALVLSVVVLVYSGIRLSFVIGRGKSELFDYVLWLFVYAFVALPMVAQISTATFPSTTPGIAQDLIFPTVVLIALSIPFLEIGRAVGKRVAQSQVHEGVRSSREALTISLNRSAWLAVFGLAVSAFYISRVGLAALLSNRQTLSDARAVVFGDPTSAAIVSSLATLPLLVAVHAIVLGNRKLRVLGAKPRFRILSLVSLIVLLLEVNLATSSRYMLGTVLLSLVVLFGAFATRARARLTMVIVAAVMLVGFPYFGALNRREGSSAADVLTGIDALTQSGDYDSFAQIVNSMQVVHMQGVAPQQLLGPLLFWVPRSIWDSKPIDTGVLIGSAKGYFFTNLSAPVWAEGFVAASWLGSLLLIFTVGFIIGRVSVPLMAQIDEHGPLAISGAILSFYLMILLRGSLLQASASLAVILLSVAWVSTRRAQAQSLRE